MNRHTPAAALLLLALPAPAQQPPAPVATGIDVLVDTGFEALEGRVVGLITNHTGLDREGRRTVDLLAAAENVALRALFSPEHGFAGVLDQSEIGHAQDASTGLRIWSLYGDTRKPTAEMLEGLDTLVFDIQDIGCRFYTYVSTMGLAMEAAAENDLRFVVLDRPNPIDGERIEGPVLDADKESFVGWHRIPVRHGMTVGELARMFAGERRLELDLQVIECEGWRRGQTWDETGLLWVNPSPNMRSLTEALLYPGIGLLETTNLSVGRGTDTPFELIGAPWMDGRRLAAHLNALELPGVTFVPIEFKPDSSVHRGELCSGVNIAITDWKTFLPVRTGIHVACALRDLFGESWRHERYMRLLGNQDAYDALVAGKSAAEIEAGWRAKLDVFRMRRRTFLLYE